MALEIRVSDEITVIDILPQGLFSGMQIIEAVATAIKNWVAAGMKEPLTITVSPQTSTGPPSLGINVDDGAEVGTVIRGG